MRDGFSLFSLAAEEETFLQKEHMGLRKTLGRGNTRFFFFFPPPGGPLTGGSCGGGTLLTVFGEAPLGIIGAGVAEER